MIKDKKGWKKYYALNKGDEERKGVVNPALLTISLKDEKEVN